MMMTAPSGNRTGTRPRILCVDDEPQILESLRDTLRDGFDVRTATTGADGSSACAMSPTRMR